jgi:hypothetical protein
MRSTMTLAAVLGLLGYVGIITATDRETTLSQEAADAVLRDEPLTIAFRQVAEMVPMQGLPDSWCWSINSAGQAERTISHTANLRELTPRKQTRQKMEFSTKQMAAIRQALREERFFSFKENYGPVYIHGGWAKLTVVAGQWTKTVRYSSSGSWASAWERPKLAEAAPAVRVWLKMCEVVDPGGKVFEERQKVAEAIQALKK